MRTLTTVAELRRVLAPARRTGQRIGLVPTMGAFHEGHLSLMRRARADCDLVVVSLFVNPRQFNDQGDLLAYPRDQARDAELAAAEGVDYLFMPPVGEVYPTGFATTVTVSSGTDSLEGVHRGSGHFDGVTTVVSKLFNMVGPDRAYFGQKDAQQALVVRRLVSDLNLPVEIVSCPIVREPDGLAMSSRNALLGPADRSRATALHRALSTVAEALAAGREPGEARAAGLRALTAAGIEAEYLELVDPDSLEPLSAFDRPALAVIAARVGPVRLIDNTLIAPGLAGAAPGAVSAHGRTDNEMAPPAGAAFAPVAAPAGA
jgi:pantoate--beta-alanine ligase